ncbi:MAG: HD domain-containing protein [Deltaproteobacteria bacterium]|nr:HD domain-containing protein [Deltaproteobacteria bacterium]
MPEDVAGIGRVLQAGGHAAWLVGGSVRDLLLGREPRDWDIATDAPAEYLEAKFPRVERVGAHTPAFLVFAAPGAPPREVSLLRGETIEADLARRDFTINALALALPLEAGATDASVIDLYGGLADLEARVLRAVGDADARFDEDPLRPLRGVRLEAELGFAPESATLRAMERHGPRAGSAAPERLREEILRCLACEKPSHAIGRMRETGMLAVLLPEVAAMVRVAQPARYHKLDVYHHTLAALDFLAEDPAADAYLRFAVLYHDAGKPATLTLRDGEPSFIGHEKEGAQLAEARCEALRFPARETARIGALVLHHLVRYTLRWSDRTVRRFMRRVTPALLPDLMKLYAADMRAKDPERYKVISVPVEVAALSVRIREMERAGDALSIHDLVIAGEDVMRALDVPAGPAVGAALEALLEQVIADPALNERDKLLALLARMKTAG